MHCRNAILIALLAAGTAYADPPREEIAAANNLVKSGRADAALSRYRSLQVDDPESELLYYNIGCAHLEAAGEAATPIDAETALDDLKAARQAFEKAAMAEDPTIRRDARFNRVNVASRQAKNLAETGDHDAAVKAFEEAIYGYEDFLDQYPGHEGAQKNLDHMRYLLKKMLQNPPPPPPEQEQEESEQGEEEEESEDQEGSSDSEQPQEQQQQDQPGEEPAEQDDQENPQEPEDSEQQEPSDAEQQQAPNDPASDAQPGADSDLNPAEPQELPNKETIEAILEALAERDQEEQKNMRRAPPSPRSSGPWW